MDRVSLGPFPHCDQRVLHDRGVCEYCDRHPEWQALREAWGIAFTGHEPADGQLPCPADFNRPPGAGNDHRRWAGNVATSAQPVNETAASLMFFGVPGSALEIEEVPVTPATPGPVAHTAKWLRIRRRR
jgi:hypothetical protein